MSSVISKEDFARLVRQHAPQVLDFTARLLPDHEYIYDMLMLAKKKVQQK